jgi:hypothetical protein
MDRSMQIALLILAAIVLLTACRCSTMEGVRGRRRSIADNARRRSRIVEARARKGARGRTPARSGGLSPNARPRSPRSASFAPSTSRPVFKTAAAPAKAARPTIAAATATGFVSKPLWYEEPVSSARHHTVAANSFDACRTACGNQPSCTHFQYKNNRCAWYAGRPELEYNEGLQEFDAVHAMERGPATAPAPAPAPARPGNPNPNQTHQNKPLSYQTHQNKRQNAQTPNHLYPQDPTGKTRNIRTYNEAVSLCNSEPLCAGFHLNKNQGVYQFKALIDDLQPGRNFTTWVKA